MIQKWNITSTSTDYYVPIADYAVMTIITIGIMALMLIFLFAYIRESRIADRYRLKYGFDKDIELKEMDNPKNLEKRESRFKRRVFKD